MASSMGIPGVTDALGVLEKDAVRLAVEVGLRELLGVGDLDSILGVADGVVDIEAEAAKGIAAGPMELEMLMLSSTVKQSLQPPDAAPVDNDC
jgi:hypothetical protein